MKKATREQAYNLWKNNPLTLVDAIGLSFCDFDMYCSAETKLKISVRPGLMSKIPEEIVVIIDGEELLVEFDLDENFKEPTSLRDLDFIKELLSNEKTKLLCTKEHPFSGGEVKADEYWEHVDANEVVPEYEGEVVVYHCPNCGLDFTIDYR